MSDDIGQWHTEPCDIRAELQRFADDARLDESLRCQNIVLKVSMTVRFPINGRCDRCKRLATMACVSMTPGDRFHCAECVSDAAPLRLPCVIRKTERGVPWIKVLWRPWYESVAQRESR